MKANQTRLTLMTTILLATVLGACSGEYTDPSTGDSTEWNFPDDNATADQIHEAYDALEIALKVNEDVLATPGISEKTVALCNMNISDIMEAKMDLATDLPRTVSGGVGSETVG